MDFTIKNLKKKQYSISVLFFISIFGTTFCNIDIFINSELISKWYWLYIIVSICGLLFLFTKNRRTEKFGLSDYFGIILLLYCFFRTLTGQFTLSFISTYTLFIIIYYLANKLIQGRLFRLFAASVVISSLSLALYGILQYAGFFVSDGKFNVVGNFDNPAGYASALAFSLPFILYFVLFEKKWMKYTAWCGYAIIVIAIVLSDSRAGVLAVIVLSLLYVFKRYNVVLFNMVIWKKGILTLVIISILSGLYFAKKNSANGRLLIWKCTWEMIKEKPLFGHGYKSFEAEYMLYQARYFEQDPNSKFVLLADNVKHPFNEPLLLIAEFGLIAFLFLVLFVITLIRAYLNNQCNEQYILMLVFAAVFIFSCFSYPFSYPFTWLILAFSLGALNALSAQNRERFRGYWISKLLILSTSIILLFFTIRGMYYENRWFKAFNQVGPGKVQQVLSEYEYLHSYLNKNAYFLYNHAAQLNYAGRQDKSIKIVTECENLWNDYDIQMLKADNYKKLHELGKAKDSYILASQMCPNRFMPLYELVNMHDSTSQPDIALELAKEIIDKPVKIPSAAISAIKIRMKKRAGHE